MVECSLDSEETAERTGRRHETVGEVRTATGTATTGVHLLGRLIGGSIVFHDT